MDASRAPSTASLNPDRGPLNAPRRMLILNPFGIGDVLFSTPLVRAVRRAFPDAYLAYFGNRRTEQILRRNAHLNELFIYERDDMVRLWRQRPLEAIRTAWRLLRQLRQRRFDMVFDLSLGERYSFLLSMMGVPRRAGFDYRQRGRFLTHQLAMEGFHDRHVITYYVDVLDMLGVRLRDLHMELPTPDLGAEQEHGVLARLRLQAARTVIGVVPAGGVSWGMQAHYRRWPKEGFIEVARQLARRDGVRILVFGERQDQAICAEIAREVGLSAIDVSGQTTLEQFIGLIARCDLVISNDGGPVHIAASQDVRTVSIFGPVDPKVYGPFPRGDRHRVVHHEQLPCRPCYHRFRLPACPYDRACLNTLAADEVLAACEAALADVDREAAAPAR